MSDFAQLFEENTELKRRVAELEKRIIQLEQEVKNTHDEWALQVAGAD